MARVLQGEGRLGALSRWVYPGLGVLLLAITVGANVAHFRNTTPSLPTLFISFLPSAVVASLLLAGFLAVRFQGNPLPSLVIPRGSPRLILVSSVAVLGLVSLLGFVTVVSVGAWGLFMAVPILLVFIALVAVAWLSLNHRIPDAIAVYFAVWPALAFLQSNIGRGQFSIFAKSHDLQQSVFIVPMRIPADDLAMGGELVAEDVWGQLLLISPEALFVFVMFLGWVLSLRRDVSSGPARTPIDGPIAVLLGAGIASALLSSFPVFSAVWFLGGYVAPILLFYLVASTVRGERDLFRVLWGMFLGLAFLSGYHLFSKYQGFASADLGFALWNTIEFASRWNPVVGNSNVAGTILICLLPAPLAIMARAQGGALGRVIAMFVLAMALTSLFVSAARGTWVALPIAGMALFWIMPRARIAILLALVGLTIVLLPFFQQLAQAAVQLHPGLANFSTSEIGVASRLYVWQRILEVLAAPLILGIGPGLFPTLGLFYPGDAQYTFGHAHHVFLQLGIDTGLIGLAAFSVIVFLIARHSYRLIRSLEDSPYKHALKFVAIGLLAFLVTGVTTGAPFNLRGALATGLLPWALAGLVMGAVSSGLRSTKPES